AFRCPTRRPQICPPTSARTRSSLPEHSALSGPAQQLRARVAQTCPTPHRLVHTTSAPEHQHSVIPIARLVSSQTQRRPAAAICTRCSETTRALLLPVC